MEIFHSTDIDGQVVRLNEEESAHCVKVMRHREGDEIFVIDGEGTLYKCRLLDASPRAAEAEVVSVEPDWGGHPYRLNMAVCPTKNADRYEWFAEKATELGLDVITPVIGDHSERKVFKTDRLKRILLSASKQSLKGAVPVVAEPLPLKDFILSAPSGALKLICCCYEGDDKRISISKALEGSVPENVSLRSTPPSFAGPLPLTLPRVARFSGADPSDASLPEIVVLIGPEGDFSREEVALAVEKGFRPVHLGPSRLRTETAALAAVAAVYYHYCGETAME